MTSRKTLLLIGIALISANASAETFTGKPRVVDADTVVIDSERIRLEAIDAPESGQQCEGADKKRYACGQTARAALVQLIGQRAITCKADERDRYGRALGFCFVEGTDINAWLVERGHAIAYRRYSRKYVAQENAARKAKRGLWAGRFIEPWRYRRGERLKP